GTPKEWGALQERRLGEPHALAFAPDRPYLITGSASLDGRMWRWEWGAGAGADRGLVVGSPAFSDALAFSADGQLLASAVGTSAWVWTCTGPDVRERSVFKNFRGDIKSVAFAPDGRSLACGEDGVARVRTMGRIWDGVGPNLGGHHGSVVSLAYSP